MMRSLPLVGLRHAITLSVPSPLAGEGQGEGCHTTCSLNWTSRNTRTPQTPFPGPPLSPALPRKGGGSAPFLRQHDMRNDDAERRFP